MSDTSNDPWQFVRSQTSLERALLSAPLDRRTFSEWTNDMIRASGNKKSHVVRLSLLDTTFAYQLISGTRNGSRNKLLQLAFGMGLGIEDACELLQRGGVSPLLAYDWRDIAIAYCLDRGMGVAECDETLSRAGIEPLRKGYPKA